MSRWRWPNQSQAELIEFYGDPCDSDGAASRTWENLYLTRVSPPWKLVTAWDGRPVASIRVHRLCAPSLERVLAEIWESSGRSQAKIEEWGMHLFAGAYQFRQTRGANHLSTHAYGCAVDFDSARNGLGDPTPNFANIPEVLNAFAREGWVWGGRWRRPDGMHWQAAVPS